MKAFLADLRFSETDSRIAAAALVEPSDILRVNEPRRRMKDDIFLKKQKMMVREQVVKWWMKRI